MTSRRGWQRRLGRLCLATLYTKALAADNTQKTLLGRADNGTSKPNILFILTDDQDSHMDSLSYMPHLQKYLVENGTTYTEHYCTVSLCCPSRVNMWTGKAAHNTNVTDLSPPYGGYPVFVENGFNEAYLPIWLQEAGYSTYYVGKFMNSHSISTCNAPFAAGWTGSDFLLDPFTYQYYNSVFQRNQDPPVNHSGEYSADLVKNKSLGFLDEWAAAADGSPFFLAAAPTAPHSNVIIGGNWVNETYFNETSSTQSPPVPATRHADLFPDAIVPRTPNFNPDKPNGVSWIATLAQQDKDNIDYNDSWYRNRLRTLQAVDEMIEEFIIKLSGLGVLENTYIFFTTDNGYHIGQHRLQPSKQCHYQEDVNIPLIVRGPGVAKNISTDLVTSHTDMVPTFMQLAGAALRDDFDGSPFPVSESQVQSARTDRTGDEHVNIEMWGIIIPEGTHGHVEYTNHTYKALRIIGHGYNLLYTVWCTNEHELYDLISDPYEADNLYILDQNQTTIEVCAGSGSSTSSTTSTSHISPTIFTSTSSASTYYTNSTTSPCTAPLARLLPRLDALVLVLKTCKAESCRNPWSVLHPDGSVNSLLDALNSRYDEFYVEESKVHFDDCLLGYLLGNELPADVKPYSLDLA